MRQVELLVQQLEEALRSTEDAPLATRRRAFREMQRQLHPDKTLEELFKVLKGFSTNIK